MHAEAEESALLVGAGVSTLSDSTRGDECNSAECIKIPCNASTHDSLLHSMMGSALMPQVASWKVSAAPALTALWAVLPVISLVPTFVLILLPANGWLKLNLFSEVSKHQSDTQMVTSYYLVKFFTGKKEKYKTHNRIQDTTEQNREKIK